MPPDVRHLFVSPVAATTNSGRLVQGPNWNEAHNLQQGPAALLGRSDSTPGQAATTEVLLDPATMAFVGGKLGAISASDIRSFGATGDGVADDTAAIQAAINAAMATGVPAAVFFPAGNYRITGPLTCFSTSNLTLRGVKGATTITIDYSNVASVALNATSGTTRGGALTVDGFRFVMGASVTIGPVVFEQRYSTGLTWSNNFISHYRQNTAIRLSGCFNCQLTGDNEVWGAGKAHPIVSSIGVTFSITAAATTLTSSVPWFTASMVGKAISLLNSEVFVVSAFTDSQTVTVSRPAVQTAANLAGNIATVTGSISASSNTLTLDDDVFTSADIGRIVYIPLAGTTIQSQTGVLRATVTAVSGTTVTLDRAATFTASNVYVVASPAVEIFSTDAQPDYTNDLVLHDFQVEQFNGTGMVIDGGTNIRSTALKLHARNDPGTDQVSTFNLVLSGTTTTSFEGSDIEGTATNPLGKIYGLGFWVGTTARFTNTSVVGQYGSRLAYLASGDPAGTMIFENTAFNNTFNATGQLEAVGAAAGRIRRIGGIGNGWSVAATVDNQTLNFASTALTLFHAPTGTITAGVGPGLLFNTKTADRTVVSGGNIESFSTSVTPGAETFSLAFSTLGAGALSRRMTLNSAGGLAVTGVATMLSGTAIAAGANTQAFIKASSTANLGIYYGTGAPTFSAAKGSIYSQTDAATTTTRLYVNTNGSTTWTNLTTAA